MSENKIYGYCRISTNTQNIERQVRNILAEFPNAEIHKETFTGRKTIGRDKWNYIDAKSQKGDTIVFDSVSRMSRNAEEGIELYMKLFKKGVRLVFLREPHINTEHYQRAIETTIQLSGNMIADIYINATNEAIRFLAKEQIELAFGQAEKEVLDLIDRTKGGIETARRNGKQIGQQKGRTLNVKKAVNAKKVIKKHSKDFGGSLSDIECIKLAGVSRNSFYKYKSELKSEELQKNSDLESFYSSEAKKDTAETTEIFSFDINDFEEIISPAEYSERDQQTFDGN